MATYAEYARDTDLAARRARQDAWMGRQHAGYDARVQANTDKRGGWRGMKYERASFTVVTSSNAYREGFDHIRWTPQGETALVVPDSQESAKETPNAPAEQT